MATLWQKEGRLKEEIAISKGQKKSFLKIFIFDFSFVLWQQNISIYFFALFLFKSKKKKLFKIDPNRQIQPGE